MTGGHEGGGSSGAELPRRVVVLGPKAAYWIVAGYFGLAAGLGAFILGIAVYSTIMAGFETQVLLVDALVAFVCGLPAILLAPRFFSERRGGTLEVGPEGVRKSIGNRPEQLIPWADVTEVTHGLRRVRIGKTSGVGEAVRIRGSQELLPVEADEITYKVDHERFLEGIRFIAENAQAHGVAVRLADSADW